MLGEPKLIGENTFVEYPDGSLDIGGPNGWVTLTAFERKEASKITGQVMPRMKCIECGAPVTDDFLCLKHRMEAEERSAPKFAWHVYKNGKAAIHGTTSAAMGYTRWTEYAYKQGAKSYDYENDFYFDDRGNQYTFSFDGVHSVNKQQKVTVTV
jgi:hypothetical protein